MTLFEASWRRSHLESPPWKGRRRRRKSKFFPSQIQIQPNPGLIQQSPAKLKHRKSLDFLRQIEPFQGLTPTPRAFFISCASKEATGRRRRCLFARVRCVSLVFISVRPCLFKRGEGLAPFLRSRTLGRYLSDSAAAEPMSAKRNPAVHGSAKAPGTLAEKTGRSIRCPARIRPQEARTGFGPLGIADGRQPFMPRVSHEPLPFDASLPFRSCEADAAAFRRAP